jgi:hypothetical protein
MKPIKLIVRSTGWDGQRCSRTYLIDEDGAGGLQLVEEGRPRLEAEPRRYVTDDVELELES